MVRCVLTRMHTRTPCIKHTAKLLDIQSKQFDNDKHFKCCTPDVLHVKVQVGLFSLMSCIGMI